MFWPNALQQSSQDLLHRDVRRRAHEATICVAPPHVNIWWLRLGRAVLLEPILPLLLGRRPAVLQGHVNTSKHVRKFAGELLGVLRLLPGAECQFRALLQEHSQGMCLPSACLWRIV